jgi:hypothetical protein
MAVSLLWIVLILTYTNFVLLAEYYANNMLNVEIPGILCANIRMHDWNNEYQMQGATIAK